MRLWSFYKQSSGWMNLVSATSKVDESHFYCHSWSSWQQLRAFYCCKGLIGCVRPPSGKPQYALMFEVLPELRARGAKTSFPQRSVIAFLCSMSKCPPLSVSNCCYLVFSAPPMLTVSLTLFLVSWPYLAASIFSSRYRVLSNYTESDKKRFGVKGFWNSAAWHKSQRQILNAPHRCLQNNDNITNVLVIHSCWDRVVARLSGCEPNMT